MHQYNLKGNIFSRLFINRILILCLLISPFSIATELVKEKSASGLVYIDQNGKEHRAPLLNSSVVMNVSGLLNRVKVTQRFVNESDDWINATYLFPLPDNAAVDHLRMVIDKQVVIGEIKEKQSAQTAYQSAKVAGKKASLIKQQRNDIFSTDVANIGPQEEVLIEIEYQQSIEYKSGVFSLYFPMTITPRYSPEIGSLDKADRQTYLNCLTDSKQNSKDKAACDSQWDNWLVSQESAQLAQLTSEIIKDANDPNLRVEINIYLHSPLAVKNIMSPYHNIQIEKVNEQTHHISLQNTSVLADRDFVMNWQMLQSKEAESALFVEDKGEDKYASLMVLPPDEQYRESSRINKEVTFVIDVSGSMSGSSIKQAKSALSFAIDQLADNDTFNILAFSDNTEFFASNSLPVDERSKTMAKVFIENLEASGGTNMESALQASLLGKRTIFEDKQQGLKQVVFITDASISNEEQLLTQIDEQLGDSRLFMVGIGSAPNHYFMKSSAKLGKGTYTNIGDIKEVHRKMSALFTQLSTPVLRDVKLNWADGSQPVYWPSWIGDLYQGEPLQVSFKIPKGKTVLHVSGIRFIDNEAVPWSQDINLTDNQPTKGIAILWAKARIDSVDMNRELSGFEKKQIVTKLGLDFHIITKHTSLVAVQQQSEGPLIHESIDTQIKTHLPHGNTMRLPQTGLASDLYKQYGLWLLLLAGLLWVGEIYLNQFSRNK